MKKILSVFLLLWTLILTALPCQDERPLSIGENQLTECEQCIEKNCVGDECADDGCAGDSCTTDACSPFCLCLCCPSASFIPIFSHVNLFDSSVVLPHCEAGKTYPVIHVSIWQPPKSIS